MNSHPLKFFEEHHITPRTQQVDVVEAIHKEWNNYKYFALSLPTGVGKTFIATAIADSVNRAYMPGGRGGSDGSDSTILNTKLFNLNSKTSSTL